MPLRVPCPPVEVHPRLLSYVIVSPYRTRCLGLTSAPVWAILRSNDQGLVEMVKHSDTIRLFTGDMVQSEMDSFCREEQYIPQVLYRCTWEQIRRILISKGYTFVIEGPYDFFKPAAVLLSRLLCLQLRHANYRKR